MYERSPLDNQSNKFYCDCENDPKLWNLQLLTHRFKEKDYSIVELTSIYWVTNQLISIHPFVQGALRDLNTNIFRRLEVNNKKKQNKLESQEKLRLPQTQVEKLQRDIEAFNLLRTRQLEIHEVIKNAKYVRNMLQAGGEGHYNEDVSSKAADPEQPNPKYLWWDSYCKLLHSIDPTLPDLTDQSTKPR